MDEDSYYRFSTHAMELEGNSEYLRIGDDEDEESLSQSISLPSLPVSLQEQLVCPEIVSSNKNQVMSMKEIDEKLNALRRENFDLKLRLYCSSQNKGFPRFSEKYYNSSATQTDSNENTYTPFHYIKIPNLILKLSQATQTVSKTTADCGIQTNHVQPSCEDRNTSTDQLNVSSVSIQTELPSIPPKEIATSVDSPNLMPEQQHLNHCKSIQLRLNEQLNQKYNHSPRQSKELVTTAVSSESRLNNSFDLTNLSSLKPKIKSAFIGGHNFDFSLIINQSPSILKHTSFNSDKTITPDKPKEPIKNVASSECEYLAGEIDSRISMLSNLSKSKSLISINHTPQLKKSTNCENDSSLVNDNLHLKHKQSIPESIYSQDNGELFVHRSAGKINDIINRQIGRTITNTSDKKREPMVRLDCRVDVNANLIMDKPTGKRLSRNCDDLENHHFASPDLGIGDSDQDLNSDLKAYIPLGYYQLLRCNLHQLSSHLNFLDNLYRDCFLLQSISISEYSTEIKPSLTHLNQTINLSRNICKNFTIEDENSISLRLDKIKAKKESMEKAITRQLRKTDKLLRKAKANLKAT